MDDLVAASQRHNVTCIVIGAEPAASFGTPFTPEQRQDNAAAFQQDFPPPYEDQAERVAADSEELVQLRSQVQSLTGQLASADQALADANARASEAPPQPAAEAPVEAQGAENPSRDDSSIEMLGFSDPAIERKLMRIGLDTVSKLAEAYGRGSEGPLWNGDKAILKKDWLIEVGMKVIAGSPPSRAATPPVGGAPASDVPEGHSDRPWAERLAAARAKQSSLNQARSIVVDRQAEVDGLEQAEDEVPVDLLDALLSAEDDVKLMRAQLVATRWCLGLDPDPELSLDESLDRANLGPWMETPQPRLLGDDSP
jgi:hypothetical protein